jgi:hypothetical protein
MKAVWESGRIDQRFLDLGTGWEVSGQPQAPAALPPLHIG